jgi:hypothetical protein
MSFLLTADRVAGGRIDGSFSRSRRQFSNERQMDSSRLGYNSGNPTIPAKGLAYWPLTLWHERYSRCSRVSCDSEERTLAVVGIAILIAVDELCANFAQVARSDHFLALHAEGIRAGKPAVHQRESYMA